MIDRLKGWLKQLRALVDKDALERELDEELEYHIARETEKRVAEGLTPEAARREALLAFRGRERYKEAVRDARWTRVLEDALLDAGYAIRSLRRRPGFAVAAVLTLALGIGGATAVFSVVRAVLVEPLPYPDPGSLVRLYMWTEDDPSENLYVSAVHFREYRERAESFTGLATVYTYDETGVDLSVDGRAKRVRTLHVSPGYFPLLGARPLLGRTFTDEEERGQAVLVLSERLWRELGADPELVGRTLQLDGSPHAVVGVVSSLRDPIAGAVDLWRPDDFTTDGAQTPGNHYLSVLGRLAPGVTPDRARREMAALDRRLAESYPDQAEDSHFRLVPLQEDLVRPARATLLLLVGAVGLLLLIVCVNVATLQIVRSLGQARPTAVRAAIGAGRLRIARQILVESLVLAGAGGLAGVVVAFAGVEALLVLGGDVVPRAHEVGVDAGTLAIAVAATVATGLGFGIAPALRLAGVDPGQALRDAPRGSSSGRFFRTRTLLVATQVALALVLLSGASVLAVSLHRMVRVDLGFRTEGVLTFQLNLPASRYGADARAAFHDDLANRLARLPAVTGAAAVSWPPAGGVGYNWGTRPLTGPGVGRREAAIGGEQRIVAGEYFEVLEIPLLEGRVFGGPGDPATDGVVISRSAADRLFPGTSAVGQELSAAGSERTVVGVVGDVANDVEATTAHHVYHAHVHPEVAARRWAMTYLVRTGDDPMAALPTVREAIHERDPLLVVHDPAPLADRLGQGRGQRAFAFALTAAFAGLALLLALLGVYGVLAYVVGEQRREIGIRFALGARGRQLAAQVLRRGLAMTATGLVVGIPGALVFGRLLESLVFETEPVEPAILAAVAASLLLATAFAALVPAIRAARVPPRSVLAEE